MTEAMDQAGPSDAGTGVPARASTGDGVAPTEGFLRVEAVVDDSVSLVGLRGFLHQALELLALGDLDDVILLTHELVKNALAVGEPDVRISVQRTPVGGARVEVRDHGYGVPVLDDHADGPDDGHALGLRIVDRVADRWGVDQFLPGKIVWFELLPARLG